jgi:hypothetical protein
MDGGVWDRPDVMGVHSRMCSQTRRAINVNDNMGKGYTVPMDGSVSRQDRVEKVYGRYGPQGNDEYSGDFKIVEGATTSLTNWTTGVIIKLLETVHGQWLYRCIQIHNSTWGTLATAEKEELQRVIEEQMEQGWSDLLDEDQYLAEVNLEDLEQSSGEKQRYWPLSIRAALEASRQRRNVANHRSKDRHTTQDGRQCSIS